MQMTPPFSSPPPVAAHWGRHARPLAKLHRGDVWCECVASGWRLRERDGEQEVQFEASSDTKAQHNESYWNPGRHPVEINILSAHFNLSGLSFVLLLAWRMIPWRQISGPDVHKVHADAPKTNPSSEARLGSLRLHGWQTLSTRGQRSQYAVQTNQSNAISTSLPKRKGRASGSGGGSVCVQVLLLNSIESRSLNEPPASQCSLFMIDIDPDSAVTEPISRVTWKSFCLLINTARFFFDLQEKLTAVIGR